jgi:hypothetical protein
LFDLTTQGYRLPLPDQRCDVPVSHAGVRRSRSHIRRT